MKKNKGKTPLPKLGDEIMKIMINNLNTNVMKEDKKKTFTPGQKSK